MPPETPAPDSTPTPHAALPILGMALLAVVLFASGYFTLRGGPTPSTNCGDAEEQTLPPDTLGSDDYTKWDKPLFAIVVSGQMHGYIDPCGCSDPQYGGLTRRYNFIQSLKTKKWDVVGIDLGELIQTKGIPAQNLLKYELSVRALGAMNYKALGIGREELLTPVSKALAQVADEKFPLPRPITLTLADAAPGAILNKNFNLRQYEIIDTTKPKIGVINIIGPDLREEFKTTEAFLNNSEELPKALKAFAAAGVELGIILHHENPKLDYNEFPKGTIKRLLAVEKIRAEQARLVADFCDKERAKNKKIPPIQLMMLLTDEPEPPAFMKPISQTTQAIEIGHHGKYVGLVGIYRGKQCYTVQYQKVLMSPDWDTPKGKEQDNQVTAWMEKYYKVLEKRNLLAEAPRSPHYNQTDVNKPGLKATYVGSDRCKSCHKEAFAVWKETKHFNATVTLEKKEFPSGRQYDPECMKCHTTGFEHPGGYNDPIADLSQWAPGKKVKSDPHDLKAHNMKLRGVGCESCHGPASEHVKNTDDLKIRALLNPYRPSPAERALEGIAKKNDVVKKQFDVLFNVRMAALNDLCMKCHDTENDVHWLKLGVTQRWLGGEHPVIHRLPTAKDNNIGKGPSRQKDEPPPITIELFEEKKK